MLRPSTSPKPLRALAKRLKLPSSVLDFRSRRPSAEPGTPAGLEHGFDLSHPPAKGTVRLRCLDFSASQISIFLFENLVLSFQETEGAAFEPIRQRLQTAGSRLRRLDASYLVYALLDAIVDHSFPLMDNYAEALETHIMAGARPELLQQVLSTKKTLTALRRILWPTRDLASALQRIDSIPDVTVTFLRDVHTHTMQLIVSLRVTGRPPMGSSPCTCR